MSYDMGLYEKKYLQRALAEGLGDWTVADPIPEEKVRVIRERLVSKGYVSTTESEFLHTNPKWGLQFSIFKGEIGITLPYWDDADAAITVARADALELARDADLGFYDPQTGEALT